MNRNRHRWHIGLGVVLVFGVALPLLVWVTQPPRGASQQNTPGPESAAETSVTLSEAYNLQPEPSAGGSGTAERGRVQENVEYVIRDSKGRVKEVKKPDGN